MLKDDYNGYDEINTEVLNGKGSSAIVEYFTYRHAVVANVDFILKGKGDGIGTRVDVYGKIVAHYGNNFSTVLFHKKPSESVNVKYETGIELCRHVVDVPVLSSLTIDADLYYGDTHEQIVGKSIFRVVGIGKVESHIKGQNGFIEVQVCWGHMQPPPGRSELIPDQQLSSAMSIIRKLVSDFRKYEIYLIEVFSVSIVGHSDEDIDLWGSIKFYSSHHKKKISCLIRIKHLPRECFPTRLYLWQLTQSLAVFAIEVLLNLRDVNGRVIRKGDICWQERDFESSRSLLDRQLCSVVQGVGGYYAAVHYSIFSSGVQAMAKIYLKDKNSTMKCIKVDGSICTQYSNYNYSTLYHKEYYRRKLFAR